MFDFIRNISPADEVEEFDTPAIEPVTEDQLAEIPAGWTHLGERNGKPHYRTAPARAVAKRRPNPVASLLDRLPKEGGHHHLGGTCPHCLGSGRYSAHRGHFANEKCYRCHGKGVLDERDMRFLERRMKGSGPICHIVTA